MSASEIQPGERRSTRIERALLRRVMTFRGSPPITLVLWDGAEIPPANGAQALGRVRCMDLRCC